MNGGGRIRRGWQLAKQSWAILRADRSLALFPVISAVAIACAWVVVIGPGVALYATDVSKPVGIALWVVGGYVATFIGIYCNTALAAAAAEALEGRPAGVRDGFAAIRDRRGVIAQWALVQVTVGILLQLVQSLLSQTPVGRVVATIFGALANAAWAIATFFVVPLIALEGVGPKDAITGSARLIRERWGEGLVGNGSIGGLVMLLGVLPAVGLGVLGAAAVGASTAGGVALIALAVVLFVAALIVGSTLTAIFRVALYRFASDDRVVGGYDAAVLQSAFRPRGR